VNLKVEKAAEDSLLSDIVRLMEQAGQSQAAFVQIADRAARYYTPVVHSLALLSFLGWVFIGGIDWQDALLIAVTVLIITCPCALGLAVPVTQVLATGRLMKNGILVKSGDALERLSKITLALFDKTGTLTLGKPALDGTYPEKILQKAASLAVHSRHPLSQGLAEAYKGKILEIENIEEVAGKGLQGKLNGQTLKLGSQSWCGVKADKDRAHELRLYFQEGNNPPVAFTLKDALRPDTLATIKAFQDDSIQTILLSGDREPVAGDIASQCGIQTFYAEQTPTQKFDILKRYKESGEKVLMVGDGLNDAPVLAGADISIAPGTAIDMAQNAADIIFMGQNLAPVKFAHDIAKFSQKLVVQNFALAIIYNIFVIPLAVAGMVTPMIAALAMSGSSLIVIANSFRIKLKT
ncbi:MAG: heavy metal translocating P-type ATPase, partial [Alphaproteobacteria bacterium]